ncbi:MAG: hypothetical protein LBV20_06075 [Treponema sp.]|nr:hypothetical protein [Treponema sp.]
MSEYKDKLDTEIEERKSKKIITIPFDRNRIPPKQNIFFMPFIWFISWLITLRAGLKIKKVGMKNLKPPFLVLGSHHSFTDFYITPLALFPHRANYVSELEGFEAFGEWLYRQAGCLGTRKFVNDMALVKNIKRVMERKGILVLYPEARYSNVGTNSTLTDSLGKLIKLLKVPVVVINMKGNYLQSPIWNLTQRKEARLETTVTKVLCAEELSILSTSEIIEKLQKYLTYDEYAWQFETKQKITFPKRAEGLELVLYKCPLCKTEFEMETQGAALRCKHCNTTWHMNEYGRMKLIDKIDAPIENNFSHIPDWYEWQRLQVMQEIDSGTYQLNASVHIESLPNAVNFIDLGDGTLTHNEKGFSLTLIEYGEQTERTLFFASASMSSVHTEYNYRGKGQCIVPSTPDNSYFLFPQSEGFNVTKIQFAVEYLYEKAHATEVSFFRLQTRRNI